MEEETRARRLLGVQGILNRGGVRGSGDLVLTGQAHTLYFPTYLVVKRSE